MSHDQLFAFEADFVASLRCIPMAVRFKLDRAGIKLSLRQWSRFTRDDRQRLLAQACATPTEVEAYRDLLVELVADRAREAAKHLVDPPTDLWAQAPSVPGRVRDYAYSVGVHPPSDTQWAGLTILQRFVLAKLTRDNHDNVNFVPAMREFGLSPNADIPNGG
jgi:hypothetical protein